MTKKELIEKLEEKVSKKSNKARIVITMPGRKMVVDTIIIIKDPEDGHITGNVHVEENGEVITAPIILPQIIALCDNPALSVDLAW